MKKEIKISDLKDTVFSEMLLENLTIKNNCILIK